MTDEIPSDSSLRSELYQLRRERDRFYLGVTDKRFAQNTVEITDIVAEIERRKAYRRSQLAQYNDNKIRDLILAFLAEQGYAICNTNDYLLEDRAPHQLAKYLVKHLK